MDKNVENLFEKLNQATGEANMLATQFHLQFETMAELQKTERENIHKHYGRIILGLILTLLILLGSIIGGAIYLFTNYDIGYFQSATVGGDGTANIYDGVHYNDTSIAD